MDVLPRKTTKFWFFALAAIGFILIIGLGRCAMAECLSSASQVRAEHGVAAWSTWRNVDGHKCYMEGQRRWNAHTRTQATKAIASVRKSNASDVVNSDAQQHGARGVLIAMLRESTESINNSESVPKPSELRIDNTVTCDDNCLRLWESFNILASMERLLSYRVRAAAWDEAYTRWASQR
jgi:hypothetical protein